MRSKAPALATRLGEGFFMSLELAQRMLPSGLLEDIPFEFEGTRALQLLIDLRRTQFIQTPWSWTDDTAMTLEIVANLREFGEINPDALARGFARRYAVPTRIAVTAARCSSCCPRLARAIGASNRPNCSREPAVSATERRCARRPLAPISPMNPNASPSKRAARRA